MSTPSITDADRVKQARPQLWSPEADLAPGAHDAPPVLSLPAGPRAIDKKPKPRAARPKKPAPRAVPQQKPAPSLSLISTDSQDANLAQFAPIQNTASIPLTRYSPTIKDLPADERPRERLCAYGAHALSTAELIGILIRVGNGARSAVSLGEFLLAHFGSIKGIATAAIEELSGVTGIGTAKAAQIKAAIEFGNRLSLSTDESRPVIGSPADVANLVMADLRYVKKETLKSLLLDTKNRVQSIKTVSIGDLSSSIVHPREVFKDAVVASAASIIIAHNHPSGDPTPSTEDVTVTKRLMQAGEILGIELLDHIIIGDGTFVSLKERGLI